MLNIEKNTEYVQQLGQILTFFLFQQLKLLQHHVPNSSVQLRTEKQITQEGFCFKKPFDYHLGQ